VTDLLGQGAMRAPGKNFYSASGSHLVSDKLQLVAIYRSTNQSLSDI
jgi:hypothetical protein